MKKILTRYGVCALAVALMVPLAQAQRQAAGLQAAFGEDAGTLSDKFTALARRIVGISGTVRNFGVPVEARQSLIMPELC